MDVLHEIPVLYRDDCLIALDKPSGLLSVPGRAPEHKNSLALRVQDVYPDARVVHRLDCATSGVMILAMNLESQRALSRQFQERQVAKTYEAVCVGRLEEDEGEVDLPLICDWPNRPRQIVDHEAGKPSQTRWRVLNREEDRTRVRLTPITGRSHQLRVHMQALGHPILGDALYATPEAQQMATRLLLHAAVLEIAHPQNDEPLRFEAPLPF